MHNITKELLEKVKLPLVIHITKTKEEILTSDFIDALVIHKRRTVKMQGWYKHVNVQN